MCLRSWPAALLLFVMLLASACAPAGGPSASQMPPAAGVPQVNRTLSVLLRNEPGALIDTLAGRAAFTVAMFGAPLTGLESGVPYPVLSSVPELNTDTWRTFPDGTMETTFRLKPGLRWHDGEPFTADAMVFGYQVAKAKLQHGLPVNEIGLVRAMEEVLAPAPDTVVIRWLSLFQEAATPTLRSAGPLPRHILGEALENIGANPQAFANHPYWTTEFVHVGPYRLTQWQRGAFLEGAAFAGYVLGRPKIDRVVVAWNGDPTVIVTRLLARDAHLALDYALQFEEALTLRREWSRSGDGVLVLVPSVTRHVGAQLRPAYANPRAILDPRVRKASLHAIDRKALADALLEGEGLVAETAALPGEPYYDELQRVAEKYPFDLRRSDELMRQAGFVKGADGMYASLEEGRFAPEVLGIADGQEVRETTAVADYFRRAGIDAHLRLVPAIQMNNDNELKATFPTWRTVQNLTPDKLSGPTIAAPENRWAGVNKMGWLNAENDRLLELWKTSLDYREQNQLMVQMYRNMNEDLPALPLYLNFSVTAHAAELQGPTAFYSMTSTTRYRNLHEWLWVR
jgi:peptide/nickel transport system substrate-binding protein